MCGASDVTSSFPPKRTSTPAAKYAVTTPITKSISVDRADVVVA